MKKMLTAISTRQPVMEKTAPQMVLSIILYQKERLKYMPIMISAAMTMGTTVSPSRYSGPMRYLSTSI